MKASVIYQYGEPDVIQYEEVPIPEIGDDELLIKVAATSFNPIDGLIRKGLFQSMFQLTFPHTLGLDVAGIVERVGSSVSNFQVGDRVYAFLDARPNGAAAEYVACNASLVAHSPKSISISDAASLPAVSCASWQALFVHGNLQKGQRVLITAAAGGVGSIALQLAKWKGAYVIGTASKRSFNMLRELGIDEIIDYTEETPATAIKEKVDLIFNLSPIDTSAVNKLLTLLKPGGILVSGTMPADSSEAERLGVSTIRMATLRNVEQLREITRLVDEGVVKPCIKVRMPLSEAIVAHKNVGKNHGKTLLIVNSDLDNQPA